MVNNSTNINKTKENLNSDCQQFYQYQQNEHSSWKTLHKFCNYKKDNPDIDVDNFVEYKMKFKWAWGGWRGNRWYRCSVMAMVFNATFNNISLYHGGQFYWWWKPGLTGEKHIFVASNRQGSAQNVVSMILI